VAASELHTAREILEGYQIKGSQSWWRFNRRREDHLWYFTQLLEVFGSLERNRIVDELHKVVGKLKELPEDKRDPYVDAIGPNGALGRLFSRSEQKVAVCLLLIPNQRLYTRSWMESNLLRFSGWAIRTPLLANQFLLLT
jgi:hypothetical protein